MLAVVVDVELHFQALLQQMDVHVVYPAVAVHVQRKARWELAAGLPDLVRGAGTYFFLALHPDVVGLGSDDRRRADITDGLVECPELVVHVI